ncbi:MAG: CPBP family intramembrane metalloprotease [Dysgonamonadaceae bacterium]|jgi:membrane protease YdiL (CAAX protease family)|nr:CPBP family intramembrane metalloprotease [Dysgonamonadaceae bacterium]
MCQIFPAATPAVKIFYLFIFLIPCTIVAVVSIGLITMVIGKSEQSGLWTLYASMFVQGVCMFVLPVYFALKATNSQPITYLKLNKNERLDEKILFGLFVFFAAYVFVLFLTHWNKTIELPESMRGIEQWMHTKEDMAIATTERLLSVQTIGELLMNILIIGVVAAVAEEIIFRGALQQFLQEWTRNGHIAVWISAFIFSAVHLQFFGFFPRLVLGALLGYLFLYTQNLWIPIFVHFFNNTLVVIVNYFWKNAEWLKNTEKIEITPTFFVLAMVSLATTILLFHKFRKSENPKVL